MNKKKIKIEVPVGKSARVTNNGDNVVVTFVDEDITERIKTFDDAFEWLEKNKREECRTLLRTYQNCVSGSYEESVVKYRIVRAALTNNEELSMTKGQIYVPYVDFYEDKWLKDIDTEKFPVIGHIEADGKRFSVVGGYATYGALAGLGNFSSSNGVSFSLVSIGFRSVSSERIARHISTYFGRLVFEIMYGGCNTNWKWID